MKQATAQELKDAFLLGNHCAMLDKLNGTPKSNPFWVSDLRWRKFENGYACWSPTQTRAEREEQLLKELGY